MKRETSVNDAANTHLELQRKAESGRRQALLGINLALTPHHHWLSASSFALTPLELPSLRSRQQFQLLSREHGRYICIGSIPGGGMRARNSLSQVLVVHLCIYCADMLQVPGLVHEDVDVLPLHSKKLPLSIEHPMFVSWQFVTPPSKAFSIYFSFRGPRN